MSSPRALRRSRKLRLVLLLALAFAGLGAASAAALSPFAGPSDVPPLGTRGIAISRLGDSYSPKQDYNRYGYVIVGDADAAAAGALSAKALVYMSGSSIRQFLFFGVSYNEAASNGWLLKDSSGNYLRNPQFEAYIADVGNPAYQKQWASNVAAVLARNHDDGVFIDDVFADIGVVTDQYPAKYPNQQAWENAELSFVRYVGQYLKARGYYVLASATGRVRDDARSNSGELTSLFWKQLAPWVSGLYCEYWLQLPSNTAQLRSAGSDDWTKWWGRWQSLVRVAQNAGADFFAEMYGTAASTNVMRYGRASFLLDWDGKGGAFEFAPLDYSADPWNPEWTMQIGHPAGRKFRVGVGWRRNYTSGVALVNPSATTPQRVRFARTYYRADGTPVRAITLDPTSGVVLRLK